MKTLSMLLALLAATDAGAQAVQDPTRPPAALLHPVAGGGRAGVPQLQSILIGRGAGGRRVAVIDGETLRVGDRVAGARIVAIDAGTVQLNRAGKRETLTLTPPAPVPDPGKPE